MTDDVGMEPIDVIVARLVDKLASEGRDAPSSLASASKMIVADQFAGRLPQYLSGPEFPAPRALSGSAFTAVARHSACAELNGETEGAHHGATDALTSASRAGEETDTGLELRKRGTHRSAPQFREGVHSVVDEGGTTSINEGVLLFSITAGTAGHGSARRRAKG